MIRKGILALILFGCNATAGYTQIVTESWIRQAGITCGGGLSMQLQGEIDATVLRRLSAAKIQGNGTFQRSDAEILLKQFQQEEKRQIYRDYVNCLLTTMNIATTTSQLPPQEVILNSSVAVASLEIIKRGQRFILAPGDTAAIKDHNLLFTVNRVDADKNRKSLNFTWANSETGEGVNNRNTSLSNLIKLGEKCSLTPYYIDIDNKQVSFLSNC